MKRSESRDAEGILFTDLYQLTMAQVYFRTGLHETRARFDHYFRTYPDYGEHKAGFCINAGLEWLLDWMRRARIGDADIEYLRGLTGRAGSGLFDDGFLGWLRDNGHFDGVEVRAVPEGRVVHAGVPLTVVEGPLAMTQILETPLLNHLNYQTLIATKAARIRLSGQGRVLVEFGLRRGPDCGANAGTRAALIGGADFTSNVAMSRLLGTPPRGTHGHSMVQAFLALGGTEFDAFNAYAETYPDDCLLVVDTIDTLNTGLPNAIRVFESLRRRGRKPLGIRLDSGDLAYLSVQAARMLDAAGFPDTAIVLSNQLDELVLLQILTQIREEASKNGIDPEQIIGRLVFGVGTRLINSRGAAGLDGVYKLVALQRGGHWKPAIKISETVAKAPNPGRKQIWRLYDRRDRAIADLLGLEGEDPRGSDPLVLYHPVEPEIHRTLRLRDISRVESLLIDVFRNGRPLIGEVPLETMRNLREEDLGRLDAGVRRIINPHVYHVSLTRKLRDLKKDLVESARRGN